MFGRKQRLIKQSQQHREFSQALKIEGTKKILGGAVRIGQSMVTGDVISDVINGYHGGSSIGEGVEIWGAASKYDEVADRLEAEAHKSKWWHL